MIDFGSKNWEAPRATLELATKNWCQQLREIPFLALDMAVLSATRLELMLIILSGMRELASNGVVPVLPLMTLISGLAARKSGRVK